MADTRAVASTLTAKLGSGAPAQLSTDVEFETEAGDKDLLGGKARKRTKQRYQCWVHVLQATGIRRPTSDRPVDPVASVTVFGETHRTRVGDFGKTFSCVFDEVFMFQAQLDDDELQRASVAVRLEDKCDRAHPLVHARVCAKST
jgi:hypothetical protein